jgi:hypothetical protein
VNYLLVGVLVAFIAVAAANSLVMATGERARELALLRLVGATPRQVTRMVRRPASDGRLRLDQLPPRAHPGPPGRRVT